MIWPTAMALIFVNFVTFQIDDSEVERLLTTKIDFEYKGGSLGEVILALETKLASNGKLKIEILSKDLQNEGITKNQRLGRLSFKNESVGQVLTAIMIQANPRTGLSTPSDEKQVLVWAPKKETKISAKAIVFVTTRVGATKRKLKLPRAFVLKPEK